MLAHHHNHHTAPHHTTHKQRRQHRQHRQHQRRQALEASGLSYTIVRPGGMERPKDDYKATHNVVLKGRDSLFGGQVSRLQIAELVTAVIANPELGENKCLEVVAETTAPALSYEALLQAQPTEVTKEEQQQLAEAVAEARSELQAAERALSAAEAALAASGDKVRMARTCASCGSKCS
jgi:FKBP-type peptidyl-prolyl cis-trans isomerase